MKAQLRAVDNEVEHARDIAAQRVRRWRSNAEKEKLPVTNVQDSGAPALLVDEVLRKAESDHLGKK